MAGGDFAKIFEIVQRLEAGQAVIVARIDEQDKRTDRFWEQDWPGIEEQVKNLDVDIRRLQLDVKGMESIPAVVTSNSQRLDALDQFKWKALAAFGAMAVVGSTIGGIATTLIMRALG